MSFRWYPIYQRGNPQLRIFLPNFWMKILKAEDKMSLPNVVKFACPVEMTKQDIRNYLVKIYKIPIVDIKLSIQTGTFKKAPGKQYIIKDDDYKVALITLPPDQKFEYPDLFTEQKDIEKSQEMKQVEEMGKDWDKKMTKNRRRPGIPTWFGL